MVWYQPKPGKERDARPGRVIETVGRRVVVRPDDAPDAPVVCFLKGERAVVGDRVTFEDARGEGGRLVDVSPRTTALRRAGQRGEEQVLAANLGGVVIVAAATEPPYRPGLVDRYLVATGAEGLRAVLVITKVDGDLPVEVAADVARRQALDPDLRVFCVDSPTGAGVDAVAAALADGGPWALVGHSGVGKTSLAAALLPGVDVGPIGALSEYWGTGQHTTTGSKVLALPAGGELVDSPGIRTFLPDVLDPEKVRDFFPGVAGVACRYRDCLHREGEDGCAAASAVDAATLESYRRLLAEVIEVSGRAGPDGKRPKERKAWKR